MFKLLLLTAASAFITGCISQPVAQVMNPATGSTATTITRLDALLPTDVLLLGEQHDAQEHQLIHAQVIAQLAQRGMLAAVALEMADRGVNTANLLASASDQDVKTALNWNDSSWPWAAYGPAVMATVRAGVPVLGANLPRAEMRPTMLEAALDARLPGAALKVQQQLIRTGHCNLLPESQITPMTRIQIARDISMAGTVAKATLPGKVVVLLSGSAHADRLLGVPQHLPTYLKVKGVRLRAGDAQEGDKADAFDAVWPTPALPEKDYCAEFKKQMGMK